MNARPLSLTHLLIALTGPIVWAAHFFILYLAEAFACGAGATAIRWIGAMATIGALAVLAVWGGRRGAHTSDVQPSADVGLSIALPLALLSIVAILWSAMPLFLLPACMA